MNADHLYVVCTESGTIIPLANARVVDPRVLTAEQGEAFLNGSDSEISDLALEVGRPVADPFA